MTEFDCHCQVCRKEIDMCAADGSPLWCQEHCPDHDFKHCSDRSGHFCANCDMPAPDDWYSCDDDVSISFAGSRDPSEPIGTPISQLSGRPGHDGYEKFVEIAKSWGYD